MKEEKKTAEKERKETQDLPEKETDFAGEADVNERLKEAEERAAALAEENEKLKAADRTAEYKDKWMRSVAEFDNYKKRNANLYKEAYNDGKKKTMKKRTRSSRLLTCPNLNLLSWNVTLTVWCNPKSVQRSESAGAVSTTGKPPSAKDTMPVSGRSDLPRKQNILQVSVGKGAINSTFCRPFMYLSSTFSAAYGTHAFFLFSCIITAETKKEENNPCSEASKRLTISSCKTIRILPLPCILYAHGAGKAKLNALLQGIKFWWTSTAFSNIFLSRSKSWHISN